MRGLGKQQTETRGSQVARAHSGSYSPYLFEKSGKDMKNADKQKSHSPAGYQFKPNPESKAAASLCYALKVVW